MATSGEREQQDKGRGYRGWTIIYKRKKLQEHNAQGI